MLIIAPKQADRRNAKERHIGNEINQHARKDLFTHVKKTRKKNEKFKNGLKGRRPHFPKLKRPNANGKKYAPAKQTEKLNIDKSCEYLPPPTQRARKKTNAHKENQ
ncbi:MAG: hypothetical protein DBX55_01360 [Verrucomicrobia bacterium]|nr:MAG: hypothetical protein DBX55_01360 [Verrucomicrobiota bacterium]